MRRTSRMSAALGATIAIFCIATPACTAADRSTGMDSGQPRELINRPICSYTDQTDDPRACEFAQKT